MIERLRYSRFGFAATRLLKRLVRRLRYLGCAALEGQCPVCQSAQGFVTPSSGEKGNHRELPICLACGSTPRERALVKLFAQLPAQREARRIHESSPTLATFGFFRRQAGPSYLPSYCFAGAAAGARVGACRNVDLSAQPFAPGSFDVVVTLDVLEHVHQPERVVAEIHRSLDVKGVHLFTVPRQRGVGTVLRAEEIDGQLVHHLPPEYHGNPISRGGALVTRDWGEDLEDWFATLGVECRSYQVVDAGMGIPVPVEVFCAHRGAAGSTGAGAVWPGPSEGAPAGMR